MHAEKRRPAVVMSSELFQKHNQHVSLLMVTTAKNSKWFGDHEIKNLKTTGLKTQSIIRQKIFTIDSRLILKSIGKLSKYDITAINELFHESIALRFNES